MPTIEELREQLRAAETAERKRGTDEYEAVRKAATFEWLFEKLPFGFKVACRYDEPTRAALNAWRERFPKTSPINWREPEQWHGMTYTFGYAADGTPFIYGGGGSIILDVGRNSFGPTAISREHATQFESGIIPPDLMRPW